MLLKPWLKFYRDIPSHLDYPQVSLYERFMQTAANSPDDIAYDFMGTKATYGELAYEIDRFASGLAKLGVKQGDVLTISMPTAPNGIIPLYALNKLGAIAGFIHPLSPPDQIKLYLNMSKSKYALTLDDFYENFNVILHETSVRKLILAKISDYLSGFIKWGYLISHRRKLSLAPKDSSVTWYHDIMKNANAPVKTCKMKPDDTAVILYSGGTTGTPKGVELTNLNMIAQGMQTAAWGKADNTKSLLAILPIFHGFGLGVCVNAMFMAGGKVIMVPRWNPEKVAGIIRKKRPNFLVGVPKMYSALADNPVFQKTDLSFLVGAFSGADTLSLPVKEKFEDAVRKGGGNVNLLEGYGLTETVTGIMAMPLHLYKEGSMGIPFPDMCVKICKVGAVKEVSIGEEGEICISGPAVMKGYLNDPKSTAKILRKHEDGRLWLHSGDIGKMDKDGFFYFISRLKRMFIIGGINVYPSYIESVICRHPYVEDVCVVGVSDKNRKFLIKAFVVLKGKVHPAEKVKQDIMSYCKKKLLRWEMPKEIEFRDSLPKTLVGKIAYYKLEKENLTKR